MSKIHYTHCPVCNSNSIDPFITVADHSVSHENFEIWQCRNCSLRFTQDVPDENSIGPYYQSSDYISHSNTSIGLVNRLYQKVRNFTLQKKAGLIRSNSVDKGKVLDLGAGIGSFLHTMKNKGWDAFGIEPDAGAREQARQLYNIDLSGTEKLELLEPGSFDVITLWHVLEHVHQLHNYIEQLKVLLKPGGRIFIAVPNYESLDASAYKNFWAAYDVPRHLYHFTPKSVYILMQKHGMKVFSKKPMWFDSFYISLLSSRYRNQKTNWIGAGLQGLRSNIKAVFNHDAASSIIYIIGKD